MIQKELLDLIEDFTQDNILDAKQNETLSKLVGWAIRTEKISQE